MGCEVESIEFRFRQLMSTSNVVVSDRLWEARWHFDNVIFPGPRNYSTKVGASLIGSSSRISTSVFHGTVVDPA